MIIGLKCFLGLALSFGILTFFWSLLVSEILRIFIKILSKSEAHNAYKLCPHKKDVFLFLRYPCKSKRLVVRKNSFLFLKWNKMLIFAKFIFANWAYLRYFVEEIFANCHFNLKFTDFNFESFFSRKFLLAKISPLKVIQLTLP